MTRLVFVLLILTMACWDDTQARWIVRGNLCQSRGPNWRYVTSELMGGSHGQWYCVRVDSVLARPDSVTMP